MNTAFKTTSDSRSSYEGDYVGRSAWRSSGRPRLIVKRPQISEETVFIPKIVSSPVKPGYGMKVGIFGGLHGDEEAGTLACYELVRWASHQPIELQDYELHLFPVCNPTGLSAGSRHSSVGFDLNREFWKGSAQPEVKYLENELRAEAYDVIIALHSDDTSEGCYGFVNGALLSEHLLEPALESASALLPRNDDATIDGFPAVHGIIKEACYPGVLSAPPEQQKTALEIVFETPAKAPMDLQVRATVVAVQTILARFRELQAYALNL